MRRTPQGHRLHRREAGDREDPRPPRPAHHRPASRRSPRTRSGKMTSTSCGNRCADGRLVQSLEFRVRGRSTEWAARDFARLPGMRSRAASCQNEAYPTYPTRMVPHMLESMAPESSTGAARAHIIEALRRLPPLDAHRKGLLDDGVPTAPHIIFDAGRRFTTCACDDPESLRVHGVRHRADGSMPPAGTGWGEFRILVDESGIRIESDGQTYSVQRVEGV